MKGSVQWQNGVAAWTVPLISPFVTWPVAMKGSSRNLKETAVMLSSARVAPAPVMLQS